MNQVSLFLAKPLVERVRRALVTLVLFLAVAGLAWFTHRRVPIQTWLFWPYAGFCLSALVWTTACFCAGHLALKYLPPVRLALRERLLFDFAVGVLLFALGVFLLGTLGALNQVFFFAYPLCLIALGAPSLAADVRRAWRHLRTARRKRWVQPTAVSAFALAFGTLGLVIVYLTIMLPDNASFDARTYHLPLAEHYAAAGRIGRFPEGWSSSTLPHLASWLYTWPFTCRMVNLFAKVEIAAHLEFALFCATLLSVPLLVESLCPGRRARGSWAALFLFPGVFLYDSSLGLAADHVLAFWAVPLALSLRRFISSPSSPGRALLVGLMMAGAALTKYQAIYLLVPAAVVVLFVSMRELVRQRGQRLLFLARGPGLLALAALIASAPHWLANTLWHGNPVYPMLGKVFPSHPWVKGWSGPTMDEGWAPTGTFVEKVGETVKATFTFSLAPHDWPAFHRDLPVFGFLFTATLPVLLIARGARRGLLLAACALLGVFVWYWTYHQDRYLQALLPWMAACTAAGLMVAWRQGRLGRLGVIALVAFQLIWGGDVAWLPTHAMTGDVPALRSLRVLSSTFRDDQQARFRFDTGFEDLDRMLPKKATVLLHEEYLKLGLNRRAVADSARWQGAIDYRQLQRPDRVQKMLQSLGVTHVAWSRSASVNREIPVSGELVFFGYAMRYLHATRDAGHFAFGRIPGKPAPSDEPGAVAFFGCKGDGMTTIGEVDRVVDIEGLGLGKQEVAGLLERGEFVVVDPRCRRQVEPQLHSAFLRAPQWGDLTLWVRRPPVLPSPAAG